MSNFKIGQKVVCVDDSYFVIATPLMKNEIYTIRDIFMGKYEGGYRLSFLLNGVKNKKAITGREIGYKSERFRPLDHQFAEDVVAYITELELTPQH